MVSLYMCLLPEELILGDLFFVCLFFQFGVCMTSNRKIWSVILSILDALTSYSYEVCDILDITGDVFERSP